MVSRAPQKRYLSLEDVRAFYNPKTDQISLTSGDDDLSKFHISVKKGTPTEDELRDLFMREGLIGPVVTADTQWPTNVPQEHGLGALIAVTGSRGGTGKTLTAVALAHELTRRGEKVLLIDGALRDATFQYMPLIFGGLQHVEDYSSLAENFNEGFSLTTALRSLAAPTAVGDVLFATLSHRRADVIDKATRAFFRAFFTEARQAYDYVIIDGGIIHERNILGREAIDNATHILGVERHPMALAEGAAAKQSPFKVIHPGYLAMYPKKTVLYFVDSRKQSPRLEESYGRAAHKLGKSFGGKLQLNDIDAEAVLEERESYGPAVEHMARRLIASWAHKAK